jgi:hypothetical protein
MPWGKSESEILRESFEHFCEKRGPTLESLVQRVIIPAHLKPRDAAKYSLEELSRREPK